MEQQQQQERVLAGTILEPPEVKLREPLEVPQNNAPRLGEVWRFDKAGRWTKNGKYRALITMLFPDRQTIGTLPNGEPWQVNVQGINFAIDYTTMPTYPLHRLEQIWAGDYLAALEIAKHNVMANRFTRHQPLDALLKTDKRETAIICATGPSLKKAVELLRHVDRSKAYIIALNSAIDAVGRENVDYHFGLDRRFLHEWGADTRDIIGVFHPQVPPEALSEYRMVYFYGHPGRSHSCDAFRSLYSDYLFGVAELEQAANVGPTAMQFAYLMGAKNIIWLGLDSGWAKDGSTHWATDVNGQGVNYNQDAVTVRMKRGDEVLAEYESKREYIQAGHYTFGHAYWLQRAGVRVVNCTGWGIFYDHALAQQPYANYVRPDIHGNEQLLPPCEPCEFEETLKALGLWR